MTGPASLYRGVCINSNDPDNKGRIRVTVPQVFGETVSGWAWPAWPVGDLTIWPDDRMPKPGQGVWILFEDWDHLSWFGVFGPIEEVLPDNPGNYRSVLSMSLPVAPSEATVVISGRLTSEKASIPGPRAVVEVQNAPSRDGPWTPLFTAPVHPRTGYWESGYDVPTNPAPWYRAVFGGIDPYTPAATDPVMPPDPPETAVLVWDPVSPLWTLPALLQGTLQDGGKPLPQERIRIYSRTSDGPWGQPVASSTTDATGRWSVQWTRPDPYPVSLRVEFPGTATHRPCDESRSFPAMSIPARVVLASSSSTTPGAQATATGTVTWDYPVPAPNRPAIVLQRRTGTGDWSDLAAATIVSVEEKRLQYRATYTSDLAVAEFRTRVSAIDVYTESYSDAAAIDLVRDTISPPPSTTTAVQGGTVVLTGKVVERLAASVGAKYGKVQAFRKGVGDADWVRCDGGTDKNLVSDGTYSITTTALPQVGSCQFRIDYLGDGNFYRPSTGSPATVSVGVATVTDLRGTAQGHTSGTFTWTGSAGASYEIQQSVDGGAWTALGDIQTETSKSVSGLSHDKTYSYRVRAVVGTFQGTWSKIIKLSTGHPKKINSGSAVYTAFPTRTGTYRPRDGNWSWHGSNLQQAWYTDSRYAGYAVLTYSDTEFQSWFKTKYGQAALDYIKNTDSWSVWTSAKIYMERNSSSGQANPTGGKARYLHWYVTRVKAHEGDPTSALAGGDAGTVTYDLGQGKWDTIIQPHWASHVLFRDTDAWGYSPGYASFAIYSGDKDDYSVFYGPAVGTDRCKLEVSLSWNFTEIAYAAPAWS